MSKFWHPRCKRQFMFGPGGGLWHISRATYICARLPHIRLGLKIRCGILDCKALLLRMLMPCNKKCLSFSVVVGILAVYFQNNLIWWVFRSEWKFLNLSVKLRQQVLLNGMCVVMCSRTNTSKVLKNCDRFKLANKLR